MGRISRRQAMAGAAAALGTPFVAPRPARAFAGDLTDAPFIDAFGPVGTADDTATFVAALNSGAPVRLRGGASLARGEVGRGSRG